MTEESGPDTEVSEQQEGAEEVVMKKRTVRMRPVLSELRLKRNASYLDSVKLGLEYAVLPIPTNLFKMITRLGILTVSSIAIAALSFFSMLFGCLMVILRSVVCFVASLFGCLVWEPGEESAKQALKEVTNEVRKALKEQGLDPNNFKVADVSLVSEEETSEISEKQD